MIRHAHNMYLQYSARHAPTIAQVLDTPQPTAPKEKITLNTVMYIKKKHKKDKKKKETSTDLSPKSI